MTFCTCYRCGGGDKRNAAAWCITWCWDFIQLHPPRLPQHGDGSSGAQGKAISHFILTSGRCSFKPLCWLKKRLLRAQDSGVSVDSEGFLCSEVRSMATGNLAGVYTLCKSTHEHSLKSLYCILIIHRCKNLCFACGLIGPALTLAHTSICPLTPLCSSGLLRD